MRRDGRHPQRFACDSVRRFSEPFARFAFHLRHLGSAEIAHVGPESGRVLASITVLFARCTAVRDVSSLPSAR